MAASFSLSRDLEKLVVIPKNLERLRGLLGQSEEHAIHQVYICFIHLVLTAFYKRVLM